MKIESMKELRKNAEKVVEDMPNGELKTKAFEVTYTELLKEHKVLEKSTKIKDKGIPKEKSTKKRKRTKLKQEPTIKLSSEDLEKLKIHFNELSIKKLTGYTTVLFISEFITKKKKVDKWKYADIKLCYDALLRLGYDKVPAVKDIPQAVRDCISPSWKMEWFERDNEKFISLSPYGILKINEFRKDIGGS